MSEEKARAWIGIIRDAALVSIGTFILIYETVNIHARNPYIIAAGLTCFGLPATIRLDRRKTDES